MADPNQKTTKLIVIGNGFDIAYDVKSKYRDFIEYLVNDLISN